jgi:uncharacterized delta-60 repeat protein
MWLSSLLGKRSFGSRSRRSRCTSRRPRLEVLEDRCVPSSGPLDPTFGSGGIATSSVTANLFPYSMGLQADGKILEAGSVSISGGIKFGLARYTSSGSPDTSFGSGGETTTKIGSNAQAYAMAVQSDGKIVLAGQGNPGKTGADFALARYNSSGSLDTAFGSRGTLTTSFGSGADNAEAVVIQSDGKIIAAGFSSQPDAANGYPQVEFALARYNSNGSLDTSFGSNGTVLTAFGAGAPYGSNIDAEIDGMTLQSDGKIVVAGYSTITGPKGRFFTVARYNANGTLDSTFGPNHTGIVSLPPSGSYHNDEAFGVVIQADGKIVAVGNVSPARYYDEWALARFNSDGSLDGTFGSGGEVIQEVVAGAGVSDIAFAVAMQSDGKIVAAGTHSYGGSAESFALGRFNSDGSLDSTFNGTGIVTTQVGTGSDARGMAIQPADGKIVVAGGSSLGAAVARYLAADPQIGSFTASPNPTPAGSTITLTVSNITDINPSSSITQVAIYVDSNGDGKLEAGTDALLGYATQTSPGVWTLNVSTAGWSPGSYNLFAVAQDNYNLFSDPLIVSMLLT